MGWGAHAWIWMKYIYSSCVLLFISGVFQALSVKNKDFINLNIGEVWAQLHKHQQNDVASLVFGLHMRTGGEICVHESTGLSAIDFIRAVILQHTDCLHLLGAISFLALLHTDSFPSPLLAFLLLPSLGASSQWGKGEAANWDGILSTPSGVEIRMSVNVHPQLLSIGLLFSLCSLCLPVAHMVCLWFYTYPKFPGAMHIEFPGTANVKAHVGCGEGNKHTAVIGIQYSKSSILFPLSTGVNAGKSCLHTT